MAAAYADVDVQCFEAVPHTYIHVATTLCRSRKDTHASARITRDWLVSSRCETTSQYSYIMKVQSLGPRCPARPNQDGDCAFKATRQLVLSI
eukprot:scaffold141784_cov28-Prasinocladus_malaysianus.AAC.1